MQRLVSIVAHGPIRLAFRCPVCIEALWGTIAELLVRCLRTAQEAVLGFPNGYTIPLADSQIWGYALVVIRGVLERMGGTGCDTLNS